MEMDLVKLSEDQSIIDKEIFDKNRNVSCKLPLYREGYRKRCE